MDNYISCQENTVIHRNSDGSYTCYIDGMYGACVTVPQIDDALQALMEKADASRELFQKLHLPKIIGSDPLPQEDQTIVDVQVTDDEVLVFLAELAKKQNKTINTVICDIAKEFIDNNKEICQTARTMTDSV